MKTWDDYKAYIEEVDSETAKELKEIEEIAASLTLAVSTARSI